MRLKQAVFIALAATAVQGVQVGIATHHDKKGSHHGNKADNKGKGKHGKDHDKKKHEHKKDKGAFGSQGTFCENLTNAITCVGNTCVHNFQKLAGDGLAHYSEGN